MARKSKFRNTTPEIPKSLVYNVGAYVRLSVMDGHQSNSDSIENQEALLREHIDKDACLSLYSVYTDNGQTGVNFQRDSFERLLDDIRAGKINCVIVKDLSRFGRNYIEAGEYLEKIFPFMGVRFIAINDGYDSLDPATSDSLSMHLKNLVNDVYARDISRKICPVMRGKQERGEFIGDWAPYGYWKSKENKHRLVVDQETMTIVRDIFKWRVSGMNYLGIARELNQSGVLSPRCYWNGKGILKDGHFENNIWTDETVKQILLNEAYIGHMVQGKTKSALWNGQVSTNQPKENWIIVEHTHEPIVDKQTFAIVQQMNERGKQEYAEKQGHFADVVNTENVLKGLVYCGDCGKKMVRQKNVRERKTKEPRFHVRYYFYCHTHVIDRNRCVSIRVAEEELMEAISGVIQAHFETAIDINKCIKSEVNKRIVLSKKEEIKQRIELVKKQIERISRLRETIYNDYVDHLMNERDYVYAQKRYIEQEAEQKALLAVLKEKEAEERETGMKEPLWLQTLLSVREETELTRKMALELIDKIVVHSKTNITVHLRFEDEYWRLKERLLPLMEVENG